MFRFGRAFVKFTAGTGRFVVEFMFGQLLEFIEKTNGVRQR